MTWVSLCLALLVVGFTEATPVQAQNSLICTRDLCRVLRSDGQVLSSCGRGEACGTRNQDRNWVPPPSCPPLTTEETIREHTDVASCSSRRDGRIVSCCWIGDACHSDPGGSAAMGRRDIAGVKPGADAGFGGLIVRAGVSDSVLLVSTRSKPFLHPFRLKDGEFVHIWGPRGEDSWTFIRDAGRLRDCGLHVVSVSPSGAPERDGGCTCRRLRRPTRPALLLGCATLVLFVAGHLDT